MLLLFRFICEYSGNWSFIIISDAIDFIDASEENTVSQDLEEISTGNIKHRRADKNSYYENDVSDS